MSKPVSTKVSLGFDPLSALTAKPADDDTDVETHKLSEFIGEQQSDPLGNNAKPIAPVTTTAAKTTAVSAPASTTSSAASDADDDGQVFNPTSVTGAFGRSVKQSLFDDDESVTDIKNVKGVYIPAGAVEFRAEHEKVRVGEDEEIDESLLNVDGDNIDSLLSSAQSSGPQTSFHSAPIKTSAAAPTSFAPAAASAGHDDLDDDLFSFTSSNTSSSQGLDPSSFDVNAYINQSKSSGKGGLFDE